MKILTLFIAILFSTPIPNADAQQCACQAPSVWTGSTCNPPLNSDNACDDGSLGSGVASVVSSNVPGASAAAKFQSVVNKKLACCMNSIDPANPLNPPKYDCVDNSTQAFTSFDQLWSGTDDPGSGGQPYALVLTSGGNGTTPGKVISGFYTLAGAHCDQFSEFAGPLQNAKVNPALIAGQQDQVPSIGSPACAIQPGNWSLAQPSAALTAAVTAAGKTTPYNGLSLNDCTQVANMRRCPILVRAAIVTTCPRNPVLPGAQVSYVDSTTALPTTHCLAAATVRTFIHMEQIYEISGMPNMQTVDTFLQQGTATISLANIIQSKVGNMCPVGTSLVKNVCMGCTAGCGSTSCGPCPASTYSLAGAVFCTPCPIGQYSEGGAASCSSCNPGANGTYWIGNGTSPGTCLTAACTNGHTGGFGGTSPNCP